MVLKKLANKIGCSFKSESAIMKAFVHRSYLNENKDCFEHNERLEFLGDAVLELVVTEHLYNNFDKPEGELTNWRSALVKRETLAAVSRELELGNLIKLSRGEELSGGRDKDYILANTLEAFIGAFYLDSGYDEVRGFISKYLLVKLQLILDQGLHIDAKSSFQEEAQSIVGITPEYRIMNEEGPDHNKIFTVGVYLNGDLIGSGKGSSKQAAEQDAAEEGLKNRKWGKYASN